MAIHELLRRLIRALGVRTASDPLLALTEGHFKVEIANVLLQMKCMLQEGVPARKRKGGVSVPQADFLQLVDGRLDYSRGDRRIGFKDGSTDVSIVSPVQLQLEIKTRPDFGTKSQA